MICPDSNLHTKTIQEEYDNQNNMMMDDPLTDTTSIIDTNVKEENTLVFLNVHLFFSSDFFLKLDGLSLWGRAADHPSHLHFLDQERKLQEFITEPCKPCKLQTWIFVDQIFVIYLFIGPRSDHSLP